MTEPTILHAVFTAKPGAADRVAALLREFAEIVRAGIDETLLGLGRASIHDLVPEDVLVPDGFAPPTPAVAGG